MNYMDILIKYLEIYPDEKNKQSKLIEYLKNYNSKEIIDWNNFEGHVVASGFVYSIKDQKYLTLYHKDLNMFLYPGGHIDEIDNTPIQAAIREVFEETGIKDLEVLKITEDENVPFDIDTHIIPYNSRLKLPPHFHFDFRYLFIIDESIDIKIDEKEHSEYKWIDINDLKKNKNYESIIEKLINLTSSI